MAERPAMLVVIVTLIDSFYPWSLAVIMPDATMLDREEYVEQAYFFRVLSQRLPENVPLQELLAQVREEVLATTNLPMAIDYLLSELLHSGACWPAMERLGHYFTSFQTYIVNEAENERGRFDMRVAVEVLHQEAAYRGADPSPQGAFLYQFETLCRNRLSYDRGLRAMAYDPIFDSDWRQWVLELRRKIGMVDLADVIYVSSEFYTSSRQRRGGDAQPPTQLLLFGEKEGKIALANRKKDPLYLFSALQRQLGYPAVPRPQPADETSRVIPRMSRQLERIEARLKLLEDEQHGGIDITRFYERHDTPPPDQPPHPGDKP